MESSSGEFNPPPTLNETVSSARPQAGEQRLDFLGRIGETASQHAQDPIYMRSLVTFVKNNTPDWGVKMQKTDQGRFVVAARPVVAHEALAELQHRTARRMLAVGEASVSIIVKGIFFGSDLVTLLETEQFIVEQGLEKSVATTITEREASKSSAEEAVFIPDQREALPEDILLSVTEQQAIELIAFPLEEAAEQMGVSQRTYMDIVGDARRRNGITKQRLLTVCFRAKRIDLRPLDGITSRGPLTEEEQILLRDYVFSKYTFVARELDISLETIRATWESIYSKLGTNIREQAFLVALRDELI